MTKKNRLNKLNNKRVAAFGLVAVLCLMVLSGCSQATRRWFGFERTPPDETLIKTNPPLILPPDYTLRPPLAKDGGGASDQDANKTATDTRDILLKNSKKPSEPSK